MSDYPIVITGKVNKMSEIKYNLQFEKLCKSLNLGEIVGVPKALTGGFLHRMYSVETTLGKYAIKALNPKIMLRPTAMQNFINSEQITNMVMHKVPALPAKNINGNFMQEIDKQFYLIFDWVDGKSLKPNEINTVHREKIGGILADIHKTDFSELGINKETLDNAHPIDWNFYLKKGQENDTVWVDLLLENIDHLYDWNMQAEESVKLLATDRVLSHGDMDPKNVLWNQDNPVLIDWESAGYINPMQDLAETAIYWAENETGTVDKDRFFAFVRGYKSRCGTLKGDWRIVLASGFSGKLGWLEYNLRRSLRMECTDEAEQNMGTLQVTETINALKCYATMTTDIEIWFTKEA